MHCSRTPIKCVIIYCIPFNTFLNHRHLFGLVLLSIETEREERKERIGWLAENFDAGEPLAVFLHLLEEQDQLRGARRERVLRLWRPPSSNISTDLMNNSTDPNPSTATSNNCSRLTAVTNAASVDCCAQEFEFGEPFVIQDGKVLYIMTNAVKGYFLSLLLTIFSWWCLKTSLSPKTWSLVRLKRLPSQLTGENSFFLSSNTVIDFVQHPVPIGHHHQLALPLQAAEVNCNIIIAKKQLDIDSQHFNPGCHTQNSK